MSLQVWLPLNGNLKNIGISDLSFSSSGVSVVNSGKMGKCYSKDTSAGWIVSDKKIYLGKNQSMFCWVKPNVFNSSSSLTGVCGQHRYKACLNMGITLKTVSSTTGYLCVNTGTGDSRTYKNYYGTTLLTAGNWYHVGYTYDGQILNLYVNGVLDKSYNLSSLAFAPDYVYAFNWSLSDSSNNMWTDYSLSGFLNDIRMYDHTLSPKEVKEISKGKMLHWTFGNGDYDAITNLASVPQKISDASPGWDNSLHVGAINVSGGYSTGYNGGVTSPATGYHAHWKIIDDTPVMVFPKLNYSISGIEDNRWLGITYGSVAIPASTTYTVSFEAMADSEGRVIYGGYRYSSAFPDGSFYANDIPVGKWKRYSFTFTTNSTAPGSGSFYIYGMSGSNGIAYLRNWQVELGDTCHDYIRGSKTKSTQILDSSGFDHHGVITGDLSSMQSNVNTTLDNSRNYENKNYSAYFNGSTYVCNDNKIAIPDAYTIAFWFNRTTGGHIIDWRANSGEAGVQPAYLNGDTGKLQYHSSAGGTVYFNYVFNTGQWYHVAIVVTAATATLYVNGTNIESINAVHPAGTLAEFHVGCRTTYTNIPQMSMKDLRLYATALNSEDIKQLYCKPVAIDNHQNIFAKEFREGSGI